MKNICVIGAGNIGSRHLQGLAKVIQSLSIQVVDPSSDSLALAKKRYEEVKTSHQKHKVNYLQNIKQVAAEIDIAIIATNSDVRDQVTRQLLAKSEVRFIIFEKILFNKKGQYEGMSKLLARKKIKAWVNCSMRTTPFYAHLKRYFKNLPITYIVHGSLHGLMSNAIHYIDHIAYLTNCYDFNIDTKNLSPSPINSKRKGFLELSGTLNVYFHDGSFGSFICYSKGDAPFTIEIMSEKYRCLIMVMKNKSLISSSDTSWKWSLKSTPIAYQSDMTNRVVSSLINKGNCELPLFEVSAIMHLNLFEPILKFLNSHSKKQFNSFPFT